MNLLTCLKVKLWPLISLVWGGLVIDTSCLLSPCPHRIWPRNRQTTVSRTWSRTWTARAASCPPPSILWSSPAHSSSISPCPPHPLPVSDKSECVSPPPPPAKLHDQDYTNTEHLCFQSPGSVDWPAVFVLLYNAVVNRSAFYRGVLVVINVLLLDFRRLETRQNNNIVTAVCLIKRYWF